MDARDDVHLAEEELITRLATLGAAERLAALFDKVDALQAEIDDILRMFPVFRRQDTAGDAGREGADDIRDVVKMVLSRGAAQDGTRAMPAPPVCGEVTDPTEGNGSAITARGTFQRGRLAKLVREAVVAQPLGRFTLMTIMDAVRAQYLLEGGALRHGSVMVTLRKLVAEGTLCRIAKAGGGGAGHKHVFERTLSPATPRSATVSTVAGEAFVDHASMVSPETDRAPLVALVLDDRLGEALDRVLREPSEIAEG